MPFPSSIPLPASACPAHRSRCRLAGCNSPCADGRRSSDRLPHPRGIVGRFEAPSISDVVLNCNITVHFVFWQLFILAGTPNEPKHQWHRLLLRAGFLEAFAGFGCSMRPNRLLAPPSSITLPPPHLYKSSLIDIHPCFYRQVSMRIYPARLEKDRYHSSFCHLFFLLGNEIPRDSVRLAR